jgi:hypothetical protein
MKLKRRIKTAIVALLLLGNCFAALAQQSFKYRAGIKQIDSTGFYNINLDPLFIASGKPDLSDVRIIDSKNKFVTYISGDQLPKKNIRFYIGFPQVANKDEADTLTTFAIENTKAASVDHLWIRMRNTAVTRTVNLLGSDDQKNWYAIKENVLLKEADVNPEGNYEQLLSFPASTYRYIKIQVNDKNRTPISILQAGIYTQQLFIPQYTLLEGVNFTQKDSGKVSYIKVSFPAPYLVNRLKLKISGSRFYKRGVSVFELNGKVNDLLTDTVVNSAGSQEIKLSAGSKTLLIEVRNEDNAPLKIDGVMAYQLNMSVISYLEKGENYSLLTGDKNASAPNYDLALFTDSIYRTPPEIGHATIIANPLFKTKTVEPDKFPAWGIWVAVVAALLVLLTLTLKMTKEVNKKAQAE